ncbi:hypothetical protein QMK17_04055 [Rhodococcus sp. G-MC3]|uniref:hypothetical protein n=1 Tax=Rhodococcus sp. G-MC3 TaxID=3046209 RepID=UPI0024B90FB9|nr:hypothetical protein [Rhodococcus sp. G-MC3]MDJ0392506.1 hypothetical protein [Rhodococcus sp. G-MC3]
MTVIRTSPFVDRRTRSLDSSSVSKCWKKIFQCRQNLVSARLNSVRTGYACLMTDNKAPDNDTPADITPEIPEDEPKGGHPGPSDKGKNGGMATRELTPEVTEDK